MAGPNRSNPNGFDISELMDEITSFTWKVSDFAEVINPLSAINSQSMDFQAGENIGMSSTWTITVERWSEDMEEWLGVSLKLKERPFPNHQQLLAQCCICGVDDDDQDENASHRSPITDIYSTGEIQGWEFSEKVGAAVASDPDADNLVLRISLMLFGPKTTPSPSQVVEEMVKAFQIRSRDQARLDLETLLQNPVPDSGKDIKFVTKEGTEQLIMMKGFLAARNPAFKVMFETEDEVIHLPDISAPTLQVLLHFLYTGDLRPEWKNSEVVVELAHAAAKYEIGDLLEFLDMTLGSVCDLQNVGPLMALARELNLETAQKQLLHFIRRNGMSSPETFFQIVEGLLAARNAGEKRGHDGNDDDVDLPDKKKSKTGGD